MISFISFILVLLGSLNWLSIGMLQFDFVAGIFGSQANLFSRVIYVIIGAAAIWLVYAVIKQKGRIYVNSKKSKDSKLLSNITSMGKDDKNSNNNQDMHNVKDYNQNNINKNYNENNDNHNTNNAYKPYETQNDNHLHTEHKNNDDN